MNRPHSPESPIDESMLDKHDAHNARYFNNPDTSRDAANVVARLDGATANIKKEIDGDAATKERVLNAKQGPQLYEEIDLQSKVLAGIMNDPSSRLENGNFTKDALEQIEAQYNKIQKMVTELNGIIHGIPGAADKVSKDQISARGKLEDKKALDFQTSMELWRSEQARKEADARIAIIAKYPPDGQLPWSPDKTRQAERALEGLPRYA